VTAFTVRVIAITALAAALSAGCRGTSSILVPGNSANEPLPSRAVTLTQAHPVSPPSVASSPRQDPPIGLPRSAEYESIPELRDVHFDSGKALIRPVDVKVLDANAAWLQANPEYLVLIEGHSDNSGAANRRKDSNVDLGERRAQAAKNHLVAQGVDPGRITILSYGEERPQCTEQNEPCRSKNRRSRFLVRRR